MATGATLGNQNYAWWVGQNGKIYANIAGVGVREIGGQVNDDGGATIMSYADTGMPSDYLTADKRIADPVNPPKTTVTAGTGATAPVLNQGAVNATNQALTSVDTEETIGKQNIGRQYDSLISEYDAEAGRANADFTEGNQNNTDNLAKNKQNALLAGAQGRRGLRGVLGSIGALFGDGTKLADRAVMESVNDDIGEAADTFAGNASTLTKAKTRFDEDDEKRRTQAKDARKNQETELEGRMLSKRQQFMKDMAKLYGDADMTAQANDWMGRAGGLNEAIAQRTAVQATPMTRGAAAFTPGALETYLAGAGDMTVQVANNGQGATGPTLLAGRKKKDEELVAA